VTEELSVKSAMCRRISTDCWTKRGILWGAALFGIIAVTNTGYAGGHGSAGHGEPGEAEKIDYSDLKIRGISLGAFQIRSYYPVDAQKSTVQFTLHASVTTEHYEEMKHIVDENQRKIHDQIITATRMAPLALFDEPQLEAFRRRLFLRLRRALPELVIDDLHVSEFHLTVKSL
jgi:hypothetical protein